VNINRHGAATAPNHARRLGAGLAIPAVAGTVTSVARQLIASGHITHPPA
jgi:hypothetical protein